MKVKNDWYKHYYDEFLATETLDSSRMHNIAKKEVQFIKKLQTY